MKKINDFTYVKDGILLKFSPEEESKDTKFSFFIVNNKELTEKLLITNIKNKIRFGDIFFVAKKIYELIREDNEYLLLEKKFQEEYRHDPDFEIFSVNNKITALLKSNSGYICQGKNEVPISGQSKKSEKRAKLKALRRFFNRN